MGGRWTASGWILPTHTNPFMLSYIPNLQITPRAVEQMSDELYLVALLKRDDVDVRFGQGIDPLKSIVAR